jgi:hypothetical protein
MMMRIAMIAAVAGLLAGCSGADESGKDDAPPSTSDAATTAKAAGITPEPGQYRATITMTGIEIPGMPPEMAGHGAGMVTTREYCVASDGAISGFEAMLKQGQNGDCSYERFSLEGGALDAVMVCRTPEGESRMAMTGTAAPTASQFTASTAMDFGPDGTATMTFAANHERIGDCPAAK